MRFLACIFLAVALIAVAFNCVKPLPNTNFDESFLPKASTVKYVALGNDASVAGLFWIKGLTELGESYLTGKEYAYLSHVADLCTSLDSMFYTPYYFVSGVTQIGAADTSDFKILRRGTRIFKDDWRLAVAFALRLSKSPAPNKKEAADIMRRYFDSPDTTIPPHIRTIYRTFELDTMQTEVALESILNDVMQPKFKKFRQSFYAKTFRVLGYSKIVDATHKDSVYEDVKRTIDALVDHQIPPQYAYAHLLQLQAPKETKDSTNSAVGDSAVAVADSSVSKK